MNKFITFMLLLFFIITCTSCNNASKQPTMQNGMETIKTSLKDVNGNVIRNGELLEPQESEISIEIMIKQEIDQTREYALIVLQNFQQTEFIYKDKYTNKHFFDIAANSETSIPVTIPVNPATQELSILIVQMPNYKLKELDFDKGSVLENVLTYRHPVKSRTPVDFVTENFALPNQVRTDSPWDFIVLSSEKDIQKVVMNSKANTELYLSSINKYSDEAISYAIIAFKDWNQYPVTPDHDILFTNVPPGKEYIYEITLPNVSMDTNYQIIAFPYPLKVSRANFESQIVFSSFRVVVEPN